MPFIPTPDCVQSTLFFAGSGGVFAQNRFYFSTASAPTSLDLEEIDDALYDATVANYIDIMSGFWSLIGITHRAMNEAEGLQLVSPQSYPVVGAVSGGEMEAAQVAYTVTLNSGLVGRSARGRIYGIGINGADANGNSLLPAAQAVYQSKWELMLSAMETAGHAFQIVSFFEGGVARTEGRALAAVSCSVRFPLATQRRRLT